MRFALIESVEGNETGNKPQVHGLKFASFSNGRLQCAIASQGNRKRNPWHGSCKSNLHLNPIPTMIKKLKSGEFRLYSRKRNPETGMRRNLGTFHTLAAARQHERQVQFFKRQ